MKNLLLFFFVSTVLFSCGPKTETDLTDNSHRTDSLMKMINSPELTAVNKKILDNPDDANLYDERAKLYLQYKQFEDAINDSKRSLRMDSSSAKFYLTEADIFLQLMKPGMQKMF